jgi:hypothetical protein
VETTEKLSNLSGPERSERHALPLGEALELLDVAAISLERMGREAALDLKVVEKGCSQNRTMTEKY